MANRFDDRFNSLKFNRQNLLNIQRNKINTSDEVIKLLKKKSKKLKKPRALRSEISRNIRQQKIFEKGQRRDKAEDNIRIVGEPVYKEEQTKFLKRFLEIEEAKLNDGRLRSINDRQKDDRRDRFLTRFLDIEQKKADTTITNEQLRERDERFLQRGVGEIERIVSDSIQREVRKFKQPEPIIITEFKKGNRNTRDVDRTSRPRVEIGGFLEGKPELTKLRQEGKPVKTNWRLPDSRDSQGFTKGKLQPEPEPEPEPKKEKKKKKKKKDERIEDLGSDDDVDALFGGSDTVNVDTVNVKSSRKSKKAVDADDTFVRALSRGADNEELEALLTEVVKAEKTPVKIVKIKR